MSEWMPPSHDCGPPPSRDIRPASVSCPPTDAVISWRMQQCARSTSRLYSGRGRSRPSTGKQVTAQVTITGGAVSDVVKKAEGQEPAAATLSFPGGTAEFPIRTAVEGNSSIDFSTLTRQTGYTGLDYGFVNTASTQSAITYIDGEQGILRYRGYPIEELAANSTFLEVAWLLMYGELPTADQLGEFDEK